ncbi:hypothetical protein EV207_1391 [Scopulibacillus darangshiensis]|uniref:Uncharacterized protein n=1 Tax=Scopulibacillus darangshiensis TaxID=442528 RepID=A0A4R2NJV9_9BACL|nr:hypothetical protein EV207_1391 [Scopulibacillus darangshiensis]
MSNVKKLRKKDFIINLGYFYLKNILFYKDGVNLNAYVAFDIGGTVYGKIKVHSNAA